MQTEHKTDDMSLAYTNYEAALDKNLDILFRIMSSLRITEEGENNHRANSGGTHDPLIGGYKAGGSNSGGNNCCCATTRDGEFCSPCLYASNDGWGNFCCCYPSSDGCNCMCGNYCGGDQCTLPYPSGDCFCCCQRFESCLGAGCNSCANCAEGIFKCIGQAASSACQCDCCSCGDLGSCCSCGDLGSCCSCGDSSCCCSCGDSSCCKNNKDCHRCLVTIFGGAFSFCAGAKGREGSAQTTQPPNVFSAYPRTNSVNNGAQTPIHEECFRYLSLLTGREYSTRLSIAEQRVEEILAALIISLILPIACSNALSAVKIIGASCCCCVDRNNFYREEKKRQVVRFVVSAASLVAGAYAPVYSGPMMSITACSACVIVGRMLHQNIAKGDKEYIFAALYEQNLKIRRTDYSDYGYLNKYINIYCFMKVMFNLAVGDLGCTLFMTNGAVGVKYALKDLERDLMKAVKVKELKDLERGPMNTEGGDLSEGGVIGAERITVDTREVEESKKKLDGSRNRLLNAVVESDSISQWVGECKSHFFIDESDFELFLAGDDAANRVENGEAGSSGLCTFRGAPQAQTIDERTGYGNGADNSDALADASAPLHTSSVHWSQYK